MDTPRPTEEARSFEILGRLGSGGYGHVYRATMRGRDGFQKDVAVKILRDSDPPTEVLQRLKDEARLLGLLRDRALVTADPPVRLNESWAVVMEFVDGCSASQLLKTHGAFPPRVIAEIGQELTRALDKLYNHLGPEGQPLRLLHRDLKPANLQITRYGELKILDLGIAKADFESREAKTTNEISGTPGYMAPERYEGLDGPEADIFSVGVILEVMATCWSPGIRSGSKRANLDDLTGDVKEVVSLARTLSNLNDEERPTAREAERACMELLRKLEGPGMREWAEEHVASVGLEPDDLVGRNFTETIHLATPTMPPPPQTQPQPRSSWKRTVALLVGVIVLLAVAIGGTFAVTSVGGAMAWYSLGDYETVGPEQEEPVEAAPAATEPEEEPLAEPEEPEEEEPEEEEPEEEEPEEVEEADPVEEPAAPPPKPVATANVTFGSVPMGAKVYVDGRYLGVTPMLNRPLSHGSHRITLKQGDDKIHQSITVSSRAPSKYIWKGGPNWEAHY